MVRWWAGELAIADERTRRPVGHELGSEMPQVVQPVEQQPRPVAYVVPTQLPGLRHPLPHRRTTIMLRPHRHDAGHVIPAPQPFVLTTILSWRNEQFGETHS